MPCMSLRGEYTDTVLEYVGLETVRPETMTRLFCSAKVVIWSGKHFEKVWPCLPGRNIYWRIWIGWNSHLHFARILLSCRLPKSWHVAHTRSITSITASLYGSFIHDELSSSDDRSASETVTSFDVDTGNAIFARTPDIVSAKQKYMANIDNRLICRNAIIVSRGFCEEYEGCIVEEARINIQRVDYGDPENGMVK